MRWAERRVHHSIGALSEEDSHRKGPDVHTHPSLIFQRPLFVNCLTPRSAGNQTLIYLTNYCIKCILRSDQLDQADLFCFWINSSKSLCQKHVEFRVSIRKSASFLQVLSLFLASAMLFSFLRVIFFTAMNHAQAYARAQRPCLQNARNWP